MVAGRNILWWILVALVAVCVFIIFRWLVPVLFGAIGVSVPAQISAVLAFLIALAVVYGGYRL